MKSLSISVAWEETKAILAHDGRLFVSVALALIALPAAVTGLLSPGAVSTDVTPVWIDSIVLIASIVMLAGQLALIRLALGPSVSVGGAIGHGMRRMPVYLVAAILIVIGLMIAAIPFILALIAMGVPIETMSTLPATPGVVVLCLAYVALICFVAVRMLMAAAAASAEPIGPVAILRRSWTLTAGHFWALFGFMVMFFVGAVVVMIAVGAAVGVLVTLLIGPMDPLSASALVVALVQALVNTAVTILFAVMLARMYAQLTGYGDAQRGVPSSGI